MLIQVILVLLVIVVIILAGAKLGLKIKELEVQIFFWILYGVSIFTFFLFIMCGYIFYTFRNKTGALGPNGFQGEPGDKGDPGSCDQNLCRARTIAILMEKLVEKHNNSPVPSNVKASICGFLTMRNPNLPPETQINSEILKHWNLLDVKIFNDIFTQELAKVDGIINLPSELSAPINQTVSKFNNQSNDNSKNLSQFSNSVSC